MYHHLQHALTVNADAKRAGTILRFRNRTVWTAEERAAAAKKAGANRAEAKREVQDLHDNQAAHELDPQRIAKQAALEGDVAALLARCGLESPAAWTDDISPPCLLADDPSEARASTIEQHLVQITVATSSTFATRAGAVKITTAAARPPPSAASANGTARERTQADIDRMLPEFKHAPSKALDALRIAWNDNVAEWKQREADARQAEVNGAAPQPPTQPPAPPLNAEQRAFGRLLSGPLLALADADPRRYQTPGAIYLESYYPLPWILGSFPNIGYHRGVGPGPLPDAQFHMIEGEKADALRTRLGEGYEEVRFRLRSGVDDCVVFLTTGLAEAMRALPAGRRARRGEP